MSLASDDVHVYCISLERPPTAIQQVAQLLSAEERERAERLLLPRDRRRFIAGRGMLRILLGWYVGVAPHRLQFHYGPSGKPTLAGLPRDSTVQFNLSHSHELAVVAVTPERRIGVDVERLRPVPALEQVAREVFSGREYGAWSALPPRERPQAFFRCWTQKEAYLKATGDGLARPLEQVEVSVAPGKLPRLVSVGGDLQQATRWFLGELIPAPGYVGSLAVERQGWRIAWWQALD
jgi:4'-phosphopantetheinyl transferase